jgi:N-acetylmuramoyl-L-alanine amidase
MNRSLIFLGTLCVAALSMPLDASVCKLRKVFHHRVKNPVTENLELGNIVFYCDNYPQVEQKKAGEGRKGQLHLLFSPIHVSDDAKKMIQDFNQLAPASYRAQLTQRPENQQLELIIEYDPSSIMVLHENFEAITTDKGIIVRLYNYKLLQALKMKEAQMLKVSYAKPQIIIDCGHGGSDTGTIGVNKISEKEVVLALGKKLEAQLVHAGFKVCMIRSCDVFVPLDERTTSANGHAPSSLFISLHANSSPRASVSGVETYCLAPDLFHGSGLQTSLDILINPLKDQQYQLSESLAQSIHQSLVAEIRKKYPDVLDRKVQHKVAQVLVGTAMPSTLIEVGFLSNEQEAARLTSAAYQQLVVQGLFNGIKNFVATHA